MRSLVVLGLLALAARPALATGELGPEAPAAPDAQVAAAPPEGDAPEAPAPAEGAPEATPTAAAAPDPGAPPDAPPAGEVARAAFTSAVVDREPTGPVTRLTTEQDRVLFFTELVGFAGRTVTHRWEHEGEVMAEVPFEVRGARWRVYSSKQLLPGWVGRWSVSVVDDAGRVLRTEELEYAAAPAGEAPAPESGEPALEPPGPAAPSAPVDAASDSRRSFRPDGAPEPE